MDDRSIHLNRSEAEIIRQSIEALLVLDNLEQDAVDRVLARQREAIEIIDQALSAPTRESREAASGTPNAEALGQSEDAPEDCERLASMEELVEHGDWKFRVVRVQRHASLRRRDPRGVFVALMVEATNIASGPRSFGGIGCKFNLRDVVGEREYEYDSDASLQHYQEFRDDTWHLDRIGPGFTVNMPIVFDVPQSVESTLFTRATRDDQSRPIALEVSE